MLHVHAGTRSSGVRASNAGMGWSAAVVASVLATAASSWPLRKARPSPRPPWRSPHLAASAAEGRAKRSGSTVPPASAAAACRRTSAAAACTSCLSSAFTAWQ